MQRRERDPRDREERAAARPPAHERARRQRRHEEQHRVCSIGSMRAHVRNHRHEEERREGDEQLAPSALAERRCRRRSPASDVGGRERGRGHAMRYACMPAVYGMIAR